MKKKFSKKWKASKQPRKQRKYLANAPSHIKRKFLSANLNKKLREKYKRRSFPLRKGDNVKIMRGSFKKKTGKIADIDVIRRKISIEGIQRAKKDGTKVNVFFHPSVLQIQEINLDDKKRIKSLERKMKKTEETEKKIKKEEKVKEQKEKKGERK